MKGSFVIKTTVPCISANLVTIFIPLQNLVPFPSPTPSPAFTACLTDCTQDRLRSGEGIARNPGRGKIIVKPGIKPRRTPAAATAGGAHPFQLCLPKGTEYSVFLSAIPVARPGAAAEVTSTHRLKHGGQQQPQHKRRAKPSIRPGRHHCHLP